MTTTTKAKPIEEHTTWHTPHDPSSIIQYERGMSDGSRDRRDGREPPVDTTDYPRAYQDGYSRGWRWAGVRKR